MSKIAAILDGLVSGLFITGFAASKLKDIPAVGLIFTLISLCAYLIGYLLWNIATRLYPNHPRKANHWFGFAQFKQQYELASLLGLVACIMCLTNPGLLVVPALWIFVLSNTLWSIAEYHKLKHPPSHNPNFSSKQQALYLRYVLLMTAVCALSAICATAAFINPLFAFVAYMLPLTLGNVLTVLAFHACGQSLFNTFKPDHTYIKLSKRLAFDLKQSPQVTQTDAHKSHLIKIPASPSPLLRFIPISLENDFDSDNEDENLLQKASYL